MKKRKWKATREEKKRRRLNNSNMLHEHVDTANKQPEKNGVNNLFRKHGSTLFRSHWQIVQLVPGLQPGHFYAWIVVNGIMHKIPLKIPRVFYLNSKAPITEDFPGRRVKKILPHGKPNYNLIEVVITEEQFRAESKKFAALLADPEIEGIYETKVPLEFHAIVQLGCVCKLDKAVKHKNADDGWNLNELHMKTTTECSYLEQSITYFYLYHSLSDGRAIYVIYFPRSTISVVVVNPFQNKELSSSILEKQFHEACQTLGIERPTKGNITFKLEYVRSIEAGVKILQSTLLEYRHQHPQPAIAIIEYPGFQATKSGIRILQEFPCVTIPCNASDCNYQALGWQVTAGKISMQRCAASSQWFMERVLLSRYAHVPFGNIELDKLLFTADVFFSRALRDQQQVLWISDDGIPDFGGIYEGETCFVDEVNQPAYSYLGAYRKVAVELKIHHLAVNAIHKSSLLEEMDGGSLFGEYGLQPTSSANETDYDEASGCASAFQVLKQLIQRCMSDAVASGNIFADAILQRLYQWLCSPMSKLHDPALHRVLDMVMRKVFVLLLYELRKLGANIIFASFSKIIIDTGKFELLAATAYCDSLLKTLQTRDLFEWIELEPLYFWHSLLFKDQFNYGGIRAKFQTEPPITNTEGDSQVEIVACWNMAEHLTKDIQALFHLRVSEFLHDPWVYLQKQISSRTTTTDDSTCTPSITVTAAETLEDCINDHIRKRISNYFTEKLLEDVCSINKRINKDNMDQPPTYGFSSSVGYQSHKGDAALEFIKHISAVLALDQNVQHDVWRMRKNLLRLVHVKEFAPEAQFHDPCPSFILPNVICSYCNDYRDLDLGRDSVFWKDEWRCAVPQCGQPYNREQMENLLLKIVMQRERLYHLQDLVCIKCRQVKAARLAELCDCGGSYQCYENASTFLSKMQVIHNIAARQNFQLLHNCTTWILQQE
ncbi:DNA polymerase epsilon catalytic subunit A-like [Zingiber officinale]|uniref:DNA polymerase epsilon catalytic subunit A-like n=1 Tax=Zingiber officinale TaxID=94328 RepID=UPI001C4AE46A|nr:DNA polymerase epsilon catalytic subunit A-like [Zingiber officinale]